jgi:hypothetical protein
MVELIKENYDVDAGDDVYDIFYTCRNGFQELLIRTNSSFLFECQYQGYYYFENSVFAFFKVVNENLPITKCKTILMDEILSFHNDYGLNPSVIKLFHCVPSLCFLEECNKIVKVGYTVVPTVFVPIVVENQCRPKEYVLHTPIYYSFENKEKKEDESWIKVAIRGRWKYDLERECYQIEKEENLVFMYL